MAKGVLDEVREYKLPAIEQEGRLKVADDGPEVLLFARSGFSDELQVAAQADDRVTLIGFDELVCELDREADQP